MKRYIVLVSTFVCGLLYVQAETLTLDDCRSRALEYNKSLASSRLQIQKQEADLKAMKTNFLPNFKIIAADFYNTGKTTLNPDLSTTFAGGIANAQNVLAQLAANPAYTPLVGGIKSIANGFKMPDDFLEFKIGNVFTAGYKMNKLGVSMAQNKVRLTEQEVLLNTDNAYVLCIRAKEMGGVARSYKAVLDELKKTVENARKHGVRTQNDVLKVQVKLNEAELNILKADNAYRLAQMNLAQVIGAPLTERIEVTTDGLYIPTDNNVLFDGSTDITNRPEYDLLNQKTEMARLKIKLTRSDFLPNLAMFGSYSYLNGMKLMGERLFNKGAATVGVVLKVPLFHFGEGIQKVRSAKAAYQISQLEQQELNEKMQLELLQATNLLQEAALEIAVTNKSVEQAAENMRLSKRHYEVGTETLSDHLEAQALWQQANASSVEARCYYLVAYTKYMKARGGK